MSENNAGLIYLKKNIVNGKIYIGQTHNLQNRENQYKYEVNFFIKNGYIRKCESKIIKALAKYGFDFFDTIIIENNIMTQEDLNEAEIYWIKYYGSYNDEIGYNIKLGGSNGKHSDETKEKIRICKLGSIPWNRGKKMPEEQIIKMKNLKHTEESKNKNRIAHLGKKHSVEHINKLKGKHNSPETEFKHGEHNGVEIKKGQHLSVATEFKNGQCSGENSYTAKLSWNDVINIRDIFYKEVISYNKLSEIYNVSVTSIKAVIYNHSWFDENYKPNMEYIKKSKLNKIKFLPYR